MYMFCGARDLTHAHARQVLEPLRTYFDPNVSTLGAMCQATSYIILDFKKLRLKVVCPGIELVIARTRDSKLNLLIRYVVGYC